MKILILILGIVFSSNLEAASWSSQFNTSTQQYKIYIQSDDKFNFTQGYYLTSFPCYGEYSQEFYKTIVGKNNMITLFCLFPPEKIYISYITKPIGTFVSRNAVAEGYMHCPVKIVGNTATSSIPRMQVKIQDCEKKSVNRNANREIIEEYDGIEI